MDGLVSPAITETLAELELDPRDAAVAKLAELYGRRIDAAGAAAASAERALAKAEDTGDDALIEHIATLKAKLAEQVALDRLGARLESVLVQLGATPKARNADKSAPAVTGALARLRSAGA